MEEKDREKWIQDLTEPLPVQRGRDETALAHFELEQLKYL